ncbi:uncharacterized protein LY89DRAFT_337841 [Mollisia scopiformis]|uniref:N-acetyltransferase domain-containing protein n=1 Tax=Mollisia scopiformis TaxID=149040 RepID=A0A132B957_MOLSC|nr:uncharacterized protein LY89DRAFT_337841 [Mollisia scopiformis]KUJ08197.1 hypothetical protein LY89DRAFT_337841 [Mollisia scopiformis]
MLLTSREMAQRLEEADILHISRQIDVCAQLFPDHKSHTVPIGHGVAAITLTSFGRKLNRITGYGVAGPVSENDLAAVEDLFAKNGVNTELSLCPLANPSAFQVLESRGYVIKDFINSYVRILTDDDLKEVKEDGVKISRVTAEQAQEFPSWSLAGYRDGGRAELLLETLGRIASMRADTSLYIATVEGKVAGTACMALIETTKGGVAHLYTDSTLPEYRGRGIQAALLKARLVEARKAGYDLASVQARPGNGSCRNIERAGFSLAYTKAWCVKASTQTQMAK